MPNLRNFTVSPQGFGCMGLSNTYGAADEAESERTLNRAVELGITFFDTATAYGNGHNETLVGRVLGDRSDDLIIASKFHHRFGRNAGDPPLSAREAVEASLARLGIDLIDIYYLHRIDPQIPIEESVGDLGRLVQEGKIGAVGVSEATAEQLRRGNAAYPITALQSEYSLWTRGVEVEILPACRELGIGFVAYSPLGRGFLANSEITDPNDRRRQHPRFQPEAVAANSVRRQTIEAIAARHGVSTAEVSLAWVLSKDVVPIPGTRHVRHLESNWAANNLKLTPQDVAELEVAFARGTTAGDRYPPDGMRLVAPEPA